MKRLATAFVALAALAFLSAPASARMTLADFPGAARALEELLEHAHKQKHKKLKVVVTGAGDNGASTSTTSPTGTPSGSIQPK
ncbi:MAG: hypothetical protein QOF41_1246 [Methylobacteriaceae bacterium]|jgi:phosphoribosylcarboxyaminoimidazole (NCAIR) mutase|nr:hypothetical protein [Methylobacteriaceae bacterium]